MYGYTGVSSKAEEVDLESGQTLYPGLSHGENALRWGFIRKVYGILATQIVLTTVVSAITVLYSPVNDLLRGSPGLLLFFAIFPLICSYFLSPFTLSSILGFLCLYIPLFMFIDFELWRF